MKVPSRKLGILLEWRSTYGVGTGAESILVRAADHLIESLHTFMYRHVFFKQPELAGTKSLTTQSARADATNNQVLSLPLEATSTTIGSPSSVPLSVSGPLYSTCFPFCSLYRALENIIK